MRSENRDRTNTRGKRANALSGLCCCCPANSPDARPPTPRSVCARWLRGDAAAGCARARGRGGGCGAAVLRLLSVASKLERSGKVRQGRRGVGVGRRLCCGLRRARCSGALAAAAFARGGPRPAPVAVPVTRRKRRRLGLAHEEQKARSSLGRPPERVVKRAAATASQRRENDGRLRGRR